MQALAFIHAVGCSLAANVVRSRDKEAVVSSRAPDFKRVADDRLKYVCRTESYLELLHLVIIAFRILLDHRTGFMAKVQFLVIVGMKQHTWLHLKYKNSGNSYVTQYVRCVIYASNMLTEYRDIYAIISNAKNAPIVILNQESMHQSK